MCIFPIYHQRRLLVAGYARATGVTASTPALTLSTSVILRGTDPSRPGRSPAQAHAMNGQPASRPASSTFITVNVASVKPPSV